MKDSDPLKPEFFIGRSYHPADSATETAVELLRIVLGLQDRDSSREAVSGFLVGCRGLLLKEGTLLGFPHGTEPYGAIWRTYKRMREQLVALGYIELVREGYKDLFGAENFITVYRVLRFPAECEEPLEFVHRPPERLLTVREHKTRFRWATDHIDEGKILSVKECRERFEMDYDIQEMRLRVVSDYLKQHPLVIGGVSYTGFTRKFNHGRLDRGGRLYADYTNLKKEMTDPKTGEVFYPRKTATIDGEKVVLIDIGASFLCVRAGMVDVRISKETDPYSRLSFVVDEPSRKFAKLLVSSMIALGGTKKRYTSEMKEDYPHLTNNNKISYFTGAIYDAYPFLREHVDGLEVMFIESEIILRTIEKCMLRDVPVWSLHDAIFVKQSQAEEAKAILSEQFEKRLGFPPRLDVE